MVVLLSLMIQDSSILLGVWGGGGCGTNLWSAVLHDTQAKRVDRYVLLRVPSLYSRLYMGSALQTSSVIKVLVYQLQNLTHKTNIPAKNMRTL